jgi:hypothetical protein
LKQLTLFITFISLCFGGDKIANLLQSQIQKLPPELQQQISKKPLSWKNIPGRQLNRSMMDPSDLLGEWEYEDEEATMWVTVGTDQTVPNFMQVIGMEPAEGGIGISGSAADTMDYMMAVAESYYGYGEIAMVQLSNNPLMMDYYYYYDDFPEDLELPMYMFMYMSMMGYTFADFMVADTAGGEMVDYYYEIENAGDFITIDTTLMRVDIAALTVANDAGDTTYTISGSIVPGTMDLVADTPFEMPFFDEDFGPDPDEDETMTWQFFEDGTGYEIFSGFDYYYGYYEYSDTSEIEWLATDDSISIIFHGYDDYYGYYYEYSDSITLAYEVADDMLSLSAEFDFCEDEYYYYYYDDCYEMFEMQFGITDIQDITMDFSMEMSYNGPLAIAGEIELQPDEFRLYNAYPNPFNPTTTLKYEMGSAGPVFIDVFNVSGRKIRSLYNGIQSPGQHEIRWDARDDRGRQVSSGIYLFKVHVNGKQQTAKALLLK